MDRLDYYVDKLSVDKRSARQTQAGQVHNDRARLQLKRVQRLGFSLL